MARLDRETVRAALTAAMVAAEAGIPVRRTGTQLRTKQCPACGLRSADSVVVNAATGAWECKAHGCKGDLFALVAGWNGLDHKRDFGRVLERAAAIAGVSPEPHDASAQLARAERRAAEEQRAAAVVAARAAAVARVPGWWAALSRRSPEGEEFLRRTRGVEPGELIGRDYVRFTPSGDPAVPLFDLSDGRLVNVVVRRRAPADGPKVIGLRDCPTAGSLVCRIAELDRNGADVAIATEGVMDSLAAALAFPGCVIAGAHGAGNLPVVAAAVAPLLHSFNGWLLVVPHVDGGVGERRAAEAVLVAQRCGLELDRSIRLVDVRPAKDLAEAWRGGWRWQW